MGLFGTKSAFLGVDFGASSVKVAELSLRKDRVVLTNYAVTSLIDDGVSRADALVATIEKMRPSTQSAYVSLPGSSGLVTVIDFPQMSQAELAQAIQFEARKYIPLPLEEVNLSWDVINQPAAQSAVAQKDSAAVAQSLKVLLVAAPRKDVEQYEQDIAQSSLTLSALELEVFAVVRALIGEDMGRFVIVDIGHTATNIIAVAQGVIYASRNVGIGGAHITHAIATAMGVAPSRAAVYQTERDDLLGRDGVARQNIDAVIAEVRKVMASLGSASPENIILSGGVSHMHGIADYIGKALGVTTTVGDPFARITMDDAVRRVAVRRAGVLTVAIGLAVRGIEEFRRS